MRKGTCDKRVSHEDRVERDAVVSLTRATVKRVRAEDRARIGFAPLGSKRKGRGAPDTRAVARAGRYVSATAVTVAPLRVVVKGIGKVRRTDAIPCYLDGAGVVSVPVARLERWADGLLAASEGYGADTSDTLASLSPETRRAVARVALVDRAQAAERDAARAWFRATVESVTGRARAARLARERERQASLRAREASLRAARKVEAYTVPVALQLSQRVAPLSGSVGCGSLGA